MVTGGGSAGATVGCVPGAGPTDIWLADGAAPPDGRPGAGWAEAVAVPGGGPPGHTTTLVPVFTRSKRSVTSSLSIPMQPEETNLPIVEGWLVPWIR